MGFVMDDMMPCFSRESNSALNLSLSDTGTLRGRWTTGGILGSMFIVYSPGRLPIPSGNSFRTCSRVLRFCLGSSSAAFLMLDLFKTFSDSKGRPFVLLG